MNEDQYFDYPPDLEKIISANEDYKKRINDPSFFVKRFNKNQSLDFYKGMYAMIRIMESLPRLSPSREIAIREIAIGCSLLIGEKAEKG
jgi:hypothetical protein